MKDFEFIGQVIDDASIQSMTKEAYKSKVNKLIKAAAFKYFLNEKAKHSKLDEVNYSSLKFQPYLSSSMFNNKERNLFFINI